MEKMEKDVYVCANRWKYRSFIVSFKQFPAIRPTDGFTRQHREKDKKDVGCRV